MTWATSVPILVFLGLSVLDLGPMYARDRRQTDRRQTKASLNASALWGRMHNNYWCTQWSSVHTVLSKQQLHLVVTSCETHDDGP